MSQNGRKTLIQDIVTGHSAAAVVAAMAIAEAATVVTTIAMVTATAAAMNL